MKLISQGDQHYVTEDGQFEIVLDPHFDTWCDDPHPVRLSAQDKADFRQMSDWEKRRLSDSNFAKYWALLNGEKGWYCDGDSEHTYSQWTVGYVDGEYIGTDGVEAYDTFGEAKRRLEAFIGEKLTVSRKPKPKPEELPEPPFFTDKRGVRHFEACGHQFEYDINMDCYVCHSNPRLIHA